MSSTVETSDLFSFDNDSSVDADEVSTIINQYKDIFQSHDEAILAPRRDESPIDTMLIAKDAHQDEDQMDEPISFQSKDAVHSLSFAPVMPIQPRADADNAAPMRAFVDTTLTKFPFPELLIQDHTLSAYCLFRWYQLWDVPAPALKPHMNDPWNPCSNPVTLDEINAPLLKQYPYIVSTKSNGVRV
jgi:hypothetical protein